MADLDNDQKVELRNALDKFAKMSTEEEKREALDAFARVGAKLDIDKLKQVIACGCGPSGERGIEDGLCPT